MLSPRLPPPNEAGVRAYITRTAQLPRTYVALAASETFEALVAGLQAAVGTLGAVPAVVRHDNLSAATHELKRSGGRQLTERFHGVLDHYGLRSSRIHLGEALENGLVEQSRAACPVEPVDSLRN